MVQPCPQGMRDPGNDVVHGVYLEHLKELLHAVVALDFRDWTSITLLTF